MKIRKAIAVAASSLLALTFLSGCGGSNDEFCKLSRAYDDIDYTDSDAVLDALNKLVSAAPSNLKADVTYMRDVLKSSIELDYTDDDALNAYLESVDEARMAEASANLEKACP